MESTCELRVMSADESLGVVDRSLPFLMTKLFRLQLSQIIRNVSEYRGTPTVNS